MLCVSFILRGEIDAPARVSLVRQVCGTRANIRHDLKLEVYEVLDEKLFPTHQTLPYGAAQLNSVR